MMVGALVLRRIVLRRRNHRGARAMSASRHLAQFDCRAIFTPSLDLRLRQASNGNLTMPLIRLICARKAEEGQTIVVTQTKEFAFNKFLELSEGS